MPHYHDYTRNIITNLEERKAANKQNQRHTLELGRPQRPSQISIFQIRAWRSREGRLDIMIVQQKDEGERIAMGACESIH